jgi:hypothetical protein
MIIPGWNRGWVVVGRRGIFLDVGSKLGIPLLSQATASPSMMQGASATWPMPSRKRQTADRGGEEITEPHPVRCRAARYNLPTSLLWAPRQTIGLEWQYAGIASVHAAGASDLVLRNANSGTFEVYDIAGNTLVGALPWVRLAWIGQLGDFAAASDGWFRNCHGLLCTPHLPHRDGS